jgi:uncharacterized repeat protein (TIGR01451 family)
MTCRLRSLSAFMFLACLVLAPAAHAASSPNITLAQPAATVLFGEQQTVSLTAANPVGEPTGYNLTYRVVLPPGVSYVNDPALYPTAPTQIVNQPGTNQTTLIFDNVSDLSPGSSYQLQFKVAHATSGTLAYGPGTTYTISAGAYINTDPRFVPDFDAAGQPITGASSFTGSATSSAVTTITAIDLTQAEPSPEGEIMRGVHAQRTVYTLSVRNNLVNPSTSTVVDTYLPPGLEYLGCAAAGTDNTTDAPTNPGSSREYAGAPALNASSFGGLTNCSAPVLVETLMTDPDGIGPRPPGIYTHLRYNLGTLATAATQSIQFVAAIPIRENTLDWNGAAAGNGTAPTGSAQGSNLDNNSGDETVDEQPLDVYSSAAALYNATTPVADTDVITRTAEDLRLLKSNDSSRIAQGHVTTWTLHLDASEYRYVDGIVVTDTLPDGLCPLDVTNLEGTPECAGGAGLAPSLAYASTHENTTGSWTLVWNVPGRLEPSSRYTITYKTRTRQNYQENGSDQAPVFSHDSWNNTVTTAGRDYRICTNGDVDCTAAGVKIDGDEVDAIDDLDASSAGQSAGGSTIDKTVQNVSTQLADCRTGTYSATPPGPFHTGDKVCYRLRVTFPVDVDTHNARITDFLPPHTSYIAGTAQAMASDTATIPAGQPTVTGNVITWAIADVEPGVVFDVVLAGTIDAAPTEADGDILGNLMKFSDANTPGTTFPQRQDIDVALTEPTLTLLKGVRTVNGDTARAVNTDGVTVPGVAAVQFRVDVANSGSLAATGAEVWDKLPAGLTCAMVTAISDAGTCVTDLAQGDHLRWTGLTFPAGTTVAAGTQKTLTYTVALPPTATVNHTYASEAGVRTYQTANNTGAPTTYTPLSNIDTTLTTANAPAADDPSSIVTRNVALAAAISSSVAETGNAGGLASFAASTQATIGETVRIRGSFTIPEGTTVTNPTLSFPLPTGIVNATNLTADLNGGALPPGWTVAIEGGKPTLHITAAGGSYANDSDGDASVNEDDAFTLTFDATVANLASVVRGGALSNPWSFSYDASPGNTTTTPTSTVTANIVEPQISTTLTRTGSGNVTPDQEVAYTAAMANAASRAVAHDNQLILTIPAGLTLLTGAGGTPVADGATVAGATYNATTRTITWLPADLAASASFTSPTFFVKVDDPAVAGSQLTLNLEARTTSLPGTDAGERTWSSTPTTTAYDATAANTLVLSGFTTTKIVDKSTATVGETVTWTVDATLLPEIRYDDAVVLDQLGAGLDFDALVSASCISGCDDPGEGITVTPLAQTSSTAQVGRLNVGFGLGDVNPANTDRVVRLVLRGHVRATVRGGTANVVSPNALVNRSYAFNDRTDKGDQTASPQETGAGFDQTSGPATATTTVHEPVLAITKRVSPGVSTRATQPGDTYAYTLVVSNTGNSTAFDVTVLDQPDTELLNVVLGARAADNVDDWTSADPDMRWVVSSIAAGSSATITYTASLAPSSTLVDGESVVNSALVSSAFGLDAATRAANPTFTYRQYTTPQDTVTQTVDLPTATIAQTTGAAGFPESAPAQIDQPFTWRVVLTSTATTADARNVDVTDVLPPGWTYVPGTAQLAAAPVADPAITGPSLFWNNLTDLAAGATRVLTFQATPTTQAALTTGVGPSNPHVANASMRWEDVSGATASQAGPYAAGPDPAQAILANPTADLSLTKVLLSGSPIEGQQITYRLVVTNSGPDPALHVHLHDTLPANLTLISASAPCTTAANDVDCDWDTIASGSMRTIDVLARVKAAPGATIVNTATVGATSLDPDAPDRTATVTTPTQRPRIALDKDVSGDPDDDDRRPTQPGDSYTYTLRVTNTGDATAFDVRVADQPDADLLNVVLGARASDNIDNWTAADPDMVWVIASIAPGSTATITYTADLAPSATLHDADSVDNTADVPSYFAASAAARAAEPAFGWTNYDDVTPDDVQMPVALPYVTTTIAPADGGLAQVGSPYRFQVGVATPADATARNPVAVVTLPVGWTFVPGSTVGAPAPSVSGRVLTFNLADLPAGGATQFTFSAIPTEQAALTTGTGPGNPHPASVHTTVQDASGASASADGPYMANAATNVFLDNPDADLRLTKDLTAGQPIEGHTLTYTLTSTNDGPGPALHTRVTDTLPANLTFVSVTGSAGATCTSAPLRCTWDSVAANTSVTMTVRARVVAAPGAQIVNPATTATDSDETHLTNNSDTETTLVQRPQIVLDKDVSGDPDDDDRRATQPGDSYTYTLRVTNTGDATAFDVRVADQPDTELRSVVLGARAADNVDNWTLADPDMVWVVASIAPGSTATITYTAALAPSATLHDADSVDNTADVPSYFAASTADRAAEPAFGWTSFDDVTPDDVRIAVALPYVQTTIAPADGGLAQVGSPYRFQVGVATPADADARNPVATVTLPVGWTYVHGSAVGAPEPTVSGQVLTFALADLPGGGSTQFVFSATPSEQAALTTGTGPTHPHPATVHTTVQDASGASASADGPYADDDSTNVFLDNPDADLRLTKQLTAGQAIEGQVLTYTLTSTNAGPGPALRTRITDTLPASLTLVSVTGSSGSTCTGAPLRCSWDVVSANASVTMTVRARVVAAPGAQIVNPATTATDSDEANLADNSASVTTPTLRPRMTLDKDVSGDPDDDDRRATQSGDTYTYTLRVTNTGDATAFDVRVADQPDSELLNVALGARASDNVDDWTAADPDMAWVIASIAPGSTATITYTAALAPSATLHDAGTVDNIADVPSYFAASTADRAADPAFGWTSFDDVTPDDVRLTVDVPVLAIVHTTGATGNPETAPAEIGQPFTWRVVVTNTATSAGAQHVTYTDRLPANWTYVPGSARLDGVAVADPTISGRDLTWTELTNLAAGQGKTLTFVAIPQPPAKDNADQQSVAQASGEDVSGATASADGPYRTPTDPASATLLVPLLTIAKGPDSLVADAGTDQAYTITVRNTGSGRARHVVIADTLPAGLTYTAGAATSTGDNTGFAETDGIGPSLRFELPALDPGQQLVITVPVHLDASLDDATALVNTATVVSDERPDPASDTGTITSDQHDNLTLVKSGPASAHAGEVITWTLTATNNGPSESRNTVITDTLPADVTFVDAQAPCALAAGKVVCALGILAPGAHVTKTFRTRINPGDLDPQITNNAHVGSDTPETNPADNDAQAVVNTGNSVNLRLTKVASQPTVVQGLTATYTLRVVNDGPSDAFSVKLVDTLPDGLTFVSATPQQGTCSAAGAKISCDLGRLNETLATQVIVVARADRAGTLTNTAVVSTDLNTETDPTDNTASAAVVVAPAANLAIDKTGPAQVAAGGKATYTLEVTNKGPSPATGVQITDTLPAGVIFDSASPGCTAAGSTVTCAVGDLAVGAVADRFVTIVVPTALGSQTIENIAQVGGDQPDLDMSDNVDSADTQVGAAADLRIVKRATQIFDNGEVTYILDVFNDGPSAATAVVVTDPLPAGVTFRRAQMTQGTCSASGAAVRCELGDMASGAAAVVQITGFVDVPTAGSTIVNTATVSAPVLDPNPANNTSQVAGVVSSAPPPRFDLGVTKVASVPQAAVGVPFFYTITVTNSGPGTARNVQLADPVPAGLHIIAIHAGQGACTLDHQLVSCALGTLDAGASTKVTVRVSSATTGAFMNVALVAADGTDGKPVGNRAVAGIEVMSSSAKIRLTKTALRKTVQAGGTARFRLTVRAIGGAARNVRVCDKLPTGLVFVRAPGARYASGQACWTIKLLAAGQHRSFLLTARAELGRRGATVNHATVTASGLGKRYARASVKVTPNRHGVAGIHSGGVTG